MGALRTGIVGLGRMGRHHIRCAGLAEGIELVGGADLDPSRADGLDDGIYFTTDVDELIEACEAIVLAVPTDSHEELAQRILAEGRHLLVEKPLAPTAATCHVLEAAAAAAGVVLAVGHVERFNGAWREVSERVKRPRFVEGHRLAAFDPRGTEVDVVLDLMIHDLDLILELFGEEPERVDAVGVAVLTDRVDIANARLEFSDGALVNLTASRVSRDPVRKLRFFQDDAYLSLDLQKQRAEVFARDPGEAPWGVRREEIAAPEGHNPLVRELEDFARAVGGQPGRLPTVSEGTRAVALAERVLGAIAERNGLWSPIPEGGPPTWTGEAS